MELTFPKLSACSAADTLGMKLAQTGQRNNPLEGSGSRKYQVGTFRHDMLPEVVSSYASRKSVALAVRVAGDLGLIMFMESKSTNSHKGTILLVDLTKVVDLGTWFLQTKGDETVASTLKDLGDATVARFDYKEGWTQIKC